jgi:hypothetical protein
LKHNKASCFKAARQEAAANSSNKDNPIVASSQKSPPHPRLPFQYRGHAVMARKDTLLILSGSDRYLTFKSIPIAQH